MELSNEKKKQLLKFWFHYYGKMVYTLSELNTFSGLLETDLSGVEKVAVASFISKEGSTLLLLAIRNGSELELIQTMNFADKDVDPTKSEGFMKVTEDFYSMVINAFDKPSPPVPLEDEVIVTQVLTIVDNISDIDKGSRN